MKTRIHFAFSPQFRDFDVAVEQIKIKGKLYKMAVKGLVSMNHFHTLEST